VEPTTLKEKKGKNGTLREEDAEEAGCQKTSLNREFSRKKRGAFGGKRRRGGKKGSEVE